MHFNKKPITYDGNLSGIKAMIREILDSSARRTGKLTRFDRLIVPAPS